MAKMTNELIWIEEGYKIFAREGLKGLKVELLAKNLNLDKSEFYHYFGDLAVFCGALLRMHKRIFDNYAQELREIKSIDSDYLHLLIRYKISVMFQMQMTMEKNDVSFQRLREDISKEQSRILEPIWSEYLGILNKPDLTNGYFNIVRLMFYARITPENFEYSYLKNFITEAKETIQQVYKREFFVEK